MAMLKTRPLGRPVSLWHGFEYNADVCLPFYSHTQRTAEERHEDAQFGLTGDGRQIFCNLYPSDFHLENNVVDQCTLLLHDSLVGTKFRSVENLFQSAKCVDEADARFIALDLTPGDAARYGQGRMKLKRADRDKLIGYGVPQNEFVEANGVFLRNPVGGDLGKVRRRPDWEEVKATVMMTGLRHKFAKQQFRPQLEALIATKRNFFFIEHTTNDVVWADGGDGRGHNFLGKLLTQLFLEVRGDIQPQPVDLDFLRTPVSQFVTYH